MKLPAVVTPPYVYHGCSTWKKFWEERFKLSEVAPVNMKTLVATMLGNTERLTMARSTPHWTYRWFGSLDKMKITSLDPINYLGISGKGLITSLGLKTIVRSKKNKMSRYAINTVSIMYLSKIIKEFEKFPYEGYVNKSPKQEPTDT